MAKQFYDRPPWGRTWFEFARLVEGRTTSSADAYLTGWLDAARSYERIAAVCLMVAWLRGLVWHHVIDEHRRQRLFAGRLLPGGL